jgi:trehalose 6-phosphate phosphatase
MQRAPYPFDRPSSDPEIFLQGAALFFDVDGTLLELRASPGEVVADLELLRLLDSLRARTQGAVALVSGRALCDLDRIFAPLSFPAAGLHGAEIRFPDGTLREADPHVMDHARPEAARFVAERPGLLLEDKGATLAIHFRQRPELGPEVLRFLTTFSPRDDIAVQEGKLVVELKPAVFDKGKAIVSLLNRAPFVGRIPLFCGDDLTDEAGFAAVNELGGQSIRVGASEFPTEARFQLPDSTTLRDRLAAALEHSREAP